MGVRKKMNLGRSGGYKLSPREYKKTLQTMQSRGTQVRRARNVCRVLTAAKAFKRVVRKSLPSPAAFNIASFLGS